MPAEIVGELAYLAPEQTGRTGRAVDERADLYALGATLYELATGAPPFGVGDPLRLLHDHLARVPVAPAVANPAVPAPLSEIILHLLEKEPDRRYQTADGLAYDLERVLDAGAGHAGARPGRFQVGARDCPAAAGAAVAAGGPRRGRRRARGGVRGRAGGRVPGRPRRRNARGRQDCVGRSSCGRW